MYSVTLKPSVVCSHSSRLLVESSGNIKLISTNYYVTFPLRKLHRGASLILKAQSQDDNNNNNNNTSSDSKPPNGTLVSCYNCLCLLLYDFLCFSCNCVSKFVECLTGF